MTKFKTGENKMTNAIQNFMTDQQVTDYANAASLAAAGEKDRAAWIAGVEAVRSAKQKAIEAFVGFVKTNRHGQPFGGQHPAFVGMVGFFNIDQCWAAQ